MMGEAAIPGPPGIYLFQNRGTPQSALFSLYSNNFIPGVFTQASVRNSLALADIDADGDLDLFACDHNRHFYFFRNNGSAINPLFTLIDTNWQNIYQPSTPNNPFKPAFYDIDNDGDLDLFLSCLNDFNQMRFYRNIGSAQNALMVLMTTTFLGNLNPQYFQEFDVFDIDGDGDGDFLCSTYDGGMVFYRNVTGESPVPPDPKRPAPIERMITVLPNPGNSGTTISYVLSHPQHVNLSVYNLLGSRLATLVDGLQQPGSHVTSWDAKDRASGIYLVRFTSPEWNATQKVVITK
jgi:hypothetical protein